MKPIFFALIILMMSSPYSFAQVEPNYKGGEPRVTTPWFGTQGVEEQRADLWFITGMRPHHAGALSMSKEYLADKNASNQKLKSLAKGIIANQTFEISMLNRVEQLVSKPIQGEKEWRQIAEKGLAQKQGFVRTPMPTSFGVGDTKVTKRDVEFAKAMVIHHEGALVMCNQYLEMPKASNKYLRLLCVDILADQKREIAFMNKVVTFYDGNPDDVKIDPSMIHGMEGMNHGGMSGHDMKKMDKSKKSIKPMTQKQHKEHMEHMNHSM